MKFTKEEKSWIAYDWANSVFATIMLAAIFPIYFASVCTGTLQGADFWWSIGMSIATGIAAIVSPIMGSIADYRGMKKKLFTVFLVIGILFTGVCAIVNVWQLMLVGFIFSYIGFSCSCMLYDSFLTDVTADERMDQVSAWGFSMGYIGGSTIPFLVAIVLLTFGPSVGIEMVAAVKISILIAVVWWTIFSIPLLKNCTQKHGVDLPPGRLVHNSFTSIRKTLGEMVGNKGLLLFMLAYFFYIDGVNTVINMSTAYGTTLGLDSNGMIVALMVTQLIAFPCAILFGKIAGKVGTLNLLTISIGIYFVICLVAFVMGYGIEEEFLTTNQALMIFWVLACMVGLVQGGIQALSRSYFGKLVPKERSSEYFGIFDIFGKFAAVMGPALYAFVKGVSGRSSYAILSIILLFFLGGILMIAGRKYQS
ncbi:MAG: MFS transporter [Eubacteriales bacterium]